MPTEKSRTKALGIAAVAHGVSSVEIGGERKDQVVVIGTGVDSVCLTSSLRKRLGHAILVSVEEVKDKPTSATPTPIQYSWAPSYYEPYPHMGMYPPVSYEPTQPSCSLM